MVASHASIASMTGNAGNANNDKLTVRVSRELTERVRNAAYWNPRLTVTAITELGLKLALEKIERDGGPYPPRETKLRGGPPIK
jgi:hypothetical protein